MSTEYEAAMLARLRASRTEASRVVLDLYKSGRRMDDAVLDAIESMPRPKTVQLRRWSDNWKAFLEWMDLQAKGWKIVWTSRYRVWVTTPPSDVQMSYMPEDKGSKMNDAVAAGADVGAVKFSGSERHAKYRPLLTVIYEITRQT